MPTIADQQLEQVESPARSKESPLKRRVSEYVESLIRPEQRFRLTQVTNNHFRVNIYSEVYSRDMAMPVWRISKSQFLYVEDKAGELVVVDQTRA